MPPGSSVAPGSDRATLRSWVSRRVASAYGCGVAAVSMVVGGVLIGAVAALIAPPGHTHPA